MKNYLIVLAFQSAMTAAGYYAAGMDGEWGPKSADALARYTKDFFSQVPRDDVYGSITRIAQAYLSKQGFEVGKIDGLEGPRTQQALQAWRASTVKSVSGSISSRLMALLPAMVGIHETSKNQGQGIAALWTATNYKAGYANREPYCAAFGCYMIAKACEGTKPPFKLPETAAAFGFDGWARDNTGKGVRYRVPVQEAAAGDLVVFAFSHFGFVVGRTGAGPLLTIEANTGADGGRDGDGIYRKTRPLSQVRSIHRITA